MQDGQGVMDPIKRAEMEIEALEQAHKQELEAMGVAPAPAPEGGETPPQDGQPTDQKQAAEQPGQPAPDTPITEGTQDPQPTPAPAEDPNSETYKQRWLSLQGMYRSEVNKLKGEIARLTQMVEQAKAKPQPSSQPDTASDGFGTPGEEGFRSGLVTDAMRNSRAYKAMADKYGSEYAELHYEGIAEAAQANLAPVQEQVSRVQQLTQEQQAAETTRLLTTQVPEWQQLNVDPEFIRWTQSNVAPFSGGRTYNEVLNESYYGGDVMGCADVFNAFLKLQQTAAAQPSSQPQAQVQAPSPSHLVAPQGASAPTTTQQPAQKPAPVVNDKYIESFYRDVERGLYNGREAEMRQIEIDIYKALNGAA